MTEPPRKAQHHVVRQPESSEPEAVAHVVAAVVRRLGRLLICQRANNKRHGGLWEFPGGKAEPDEDWSSALRRELREELHVEVTEVGECLFSHADPGSSFVIHFLPCGIEGEPIHREHEAAEWVEEHMLLEYELAPADEQFARFLIESQQAESA